MALNLTPPERPTTRAFREASWPAVLRALELYSERPSKKKERDTLQRWYIDASRPDEVERPSLLQVMLCEPDATSATWRRLRERDRDVRRAGYVLGRFFASSMSSAAYAHRNTLFAGREAQVYDLFVVPRHAELNRLPEPHTGGELLFNQTASLLGWFESASPNPYSQGWRRFALDGELIRQQGLPSVARFDRESDYDRLVATKYLTPFVLACAHPEYFNPSVVTAAEAVRALMLEARGSTAFEEAYEFASSEEAMESHAWEEGCGADATILIRYSTAEHANSVVPLLNACARFPYTGEEDEKKLVWFPDASERTRSRATRTLLDLLWTTGFEANGVEYVDDRTLIFRLRLPLDPQNTWIAVNMLLHDMRRFEERLLAKGRAYDPHDSVMSEVGYVGRGVIVCDPLRGSRRVQGLGYVNDGEQSGADLGEGLDFTEKDVAARALLEGEGRVSGEDLLELLSKTL